MCDLLVANEHIIIKFIGIFDLVHLFIWSYTKLNINPEHDSFPTATDNSSRYTQHKTDNYNHWREKGTIYTNILSEIHFLNKSNTWWDSNKIFFVQIIYLFWGTVNIICNLVWNASLGYKTLVVLLFYNVWIWK